MNPKPNLIRGLMYTVPASILGFIIPFGYKLFALLNECIHPGLSDFHFKNEIRNMWNEFKFASLGCSVLLGMAALLNFSLPKPMGYLKAIIQLGLLLIPGILLNSAVQNIMEIGGYIRTYGPPDLFSPYIFIGFTIMFSFTTAYTVGKISRGYKNANAIAPKEGPSSHHPAGI